MKHYYRPVKTVMATCAALLASTSLSYAEEDIDPSNLLNMSLAELSDIEITSVSKKAEKASEAAAAIFVITNEDIKRSGVTSIPEALRMVPGVQVSQAASHQWAVSARGFNGQFANKLLVLIDGRSVYTPIFSGVLWDAQDTLLEDIERIEVIRGPGATLWGANAVNGVINIITKSSEDTVGNYAQLAKGNYEKGIAEVRHGGKLDNGAYRVYAKHNARDSLDNSTNGTNLADSWRKTQAGFRTDMKLDSGDSLTVQGDAFHIMEQAQLDTPTPVGTLISPSFDEVQGKGGNILVRYGHAFSDDSDVTVQAYYDNDTRDVQYYRGTSHTVDVDMQHEYRGFDSQEIIWGLGYRYVYNDTQVTPFNTFTPADRGDNLFSGFIQDEIEVVDDEFYLTLGSKFENNDYSGFEIQPSARFSWLINEGHTFWGAVSKAVRTPNRFVDDAALKQAGYAGPPAPGFFTSQGNRNLDSEELIAYELGYRVRPIDEVSLDLAGFYNDYDSLFRTNLGTAGLVVDPFFGAIINVPLGVDNLESAKSYGGEVAVNVDLADNWQMAGSYSFLNLTFDNPSGVGFSDIGRSPKHQFNVRSTYLFPEDVEMTNSLYYVDELSSIAINSYFRFDTRLSWQVTEDVELNLVGQNLLDGKHKEFSNFLYQRPADIGRSVYASANFRF